MTDLNISNTGVGELVLLEGWTKRDVESQEEYEEYGITVFVHTDGTMQNEDPSTPEGVIAIANAIPTMGALETITFGDKQSVTMKTDMTEADFSGKELGVSDAIIVAAFLPKCQ